jgi:hypothetical protein
LDRLLGELVSEFVDAQPDMEVVGRRRVDERLAEAVKRTAAAVAVFGAIEGELAEVARGVLEECPGLRLVALEHRGRDTVVLQLRPHWVRYGQLSPDGLVEAIRAAARPPDWEQERRQC